MEANKEIETVERAVFTTDTHHYKIGVEKLKELRTKKNFEARMKARVQKGMKQTVEDANGAQWEESYKAILEAVLENEDF
jgi:hypothetical protein